MNPDDDTSSEEDFYDCSSEPVKYFAVSLPKGKEKGFVSTNITDVREKLKKGPKGAVINVFTDPLEARKSADTPVDLDEVKRKSTAKPIPEKRLADCLPSIKDSDTIKLKLAIEQGKKDKVKEIINANPKHLVTEQDIPVLMNRFRYNPLHVAALSGHADLIRFILQSLESDELWQMLYPTGTDDNLVSAANRDANYRSQRRAIDLYLNSPESGNLETALHFAAKFGHADCVRALLSHPLINPNLHNKHDLMAVDVVCSRLSCPATEEGRLAHKKRLEEVQAVFTEKFVALLDEDGGRISSLLSFCELRHLLVPPGEKGDGGKVRAYAGPLPLDRATQLRSRWAVLKPLDATRFAEVRRTDAEKGLETHGRYLAREFEAEWRERWRFLDSFLDLGDDSGLKQFEEYLCTELHQRSTSQIFGAGNMSISFATDPDSSLHNKSSNSRFSDVYSSLVGLFSRLTLNSSNDSNNNHHHLSLQDEDSIDLRPNHLCKSLNISKVARHDQSLLIQGVPFDLSVQGRGLLTPNDRQVRQAILQSPRHAVSHNSFPSIKLWLSQLDQIDPIDNPHTPPPRSSSQQDLMKTTQHFGISSLNLSTNSTSVKTKLDTTPPQFSNLNDSFKTFNYLDFASNITGHKTVTSSPFPASKTGSMESRKNRFKKTTPWSELSPVGSDMYIA